MQAEPQRRWRQLGRSLVDGSHLLWEFLGVDFSFLVCSASGLVASFSFFSPRILLSPLPFLCSVVAAHKEKSPRGLGFVAAAEIGLYRRRSRVPHGPKQGERQGSSASIPRTCGMHPRGARLGFWVQHARR